ncbi:MAG TPA: hypothetical protein VIL86_05380 [Tepidisphaeraceae bacterium]|jgi:outer membrane protein assembly factor BamD (BamD/ComL family)
MDDEQRRSSRPPLLIRLAAIVIFAMGIVLCVLWLLANHPEARSLSAGIKYAFPALACLLFGVGLGAVLSALAAVVEKKDSSSEVPDYTDDFTRVEQAIQSLRIQMQKQPRPEPATYQPAVAPAASVATPADSKQFDRLLEMIQELREFSLMSDQQKQARLKEHASHRKTALLQQAARLIEKKQWGRAEHLLASLDPDFPGDAEVAAARTSVAAGRNSVESGMYRQMRQSVDDAMAISNWDQALSAIQKFLDDFPGNPDGKALLTRVTRERDLYRENTAGRMYDEVKHEVERRSWRRAMAAAQRLLEKFPADQRTLKIRRQMKVIQDNAEIEERQEQEQRIQELIRAKRFQEAIEMSQDLLERFPLSPQAELLEELLPKLREMAMKQEMGV